jgi:hypothetical protein
MRDRPDIGLLISGLIFTERFSDGLLQQRGPEKLFDRSARSPSLHVKFHSIHLTSFAKVIQ